MIKLVIHLFIICGISAATNLRGLVPPKDTSIQYTDEPDPAIYAAGQASAAVIAYGADVLLKGSPSSKQHGGTEPTALETPTTEDTSTTAPPADTSITPDPENPLLVKQPEPVPESKPVESAVDTTAVVAPESEKPGVEKASGYGEETKPTEDDTLINATEDHQNTMDSVAEETGESTPAIDDTSTTDSSETSTDTPVTEDTTTEETAASTPAIDDASTTDTSETSTDTPVTDESVTTPESTPEDASSSTTTTAPASDLETPASR